MVDGINTLLQKTVVARCEFLQRRTHEHTYRLLAFLYVAHNATQNNPRTTSRVRSPSRTTKTDIYIPSTIYRRPLDGRERTPTEED